MIDKYTPERKWSYVVPADDDITPVETVYTEEQILDFYWRYWSAKMKEIGKEYLISEKNCVEDWIVVNWAAEKED